LAHCDYDNEIGFKINASSYISAEVLHDVKPTQQNANSMATISVKIQIQNYTLTSYVRPKAQHIN
jgi:hypothetical protein